MRLPCARTRRPGLSLLEVLVAVAIFLMAIGGISHLVSTSSDRAIEVQIRSQAARLCQSKLAEVQTGVIPLTAQGDTPFEEDTDYQWSMTVDQGAIPNLWTVSIKVSRDRPLGGPVECSLTQMMLDPTIVGSTQDVTPIAGTDQTSATAASASTGTTDDTGNVAGGGAAAKTPAKSNANTGAGAASAKPAVKPAASPAPAAKPAASPAPAAKPAASPAPAANTPAPKSSAPATGSSAKPGGK
jgi:type II secretion system protein I